MASGCKSITNQSDVVKKMNGEKAGSWHLVGDEAAPVMDTWPSAGDVNFETYDIVPGTEKGEEGMLKIPFSCDQAVKYLDVTYVNENGQTKSIHQDCKDNTYAGFILVPATEKHTSLKITARLAVGTVTKTVDDKQDAVLHSPLRLSASLLRFSTNNQLADADAESTQFTPSRFGNRILGHARHKLRFHAHDGERRADVRLRARIVGIEGGSLA